MADPTLSELRQALSILQSSINEIDKKLDQRIVRLGEKVAVLQDHQERVLIIIDGDPATDVRGLRTRVAEVEKVIEQLKQYQWVMRGMAIGLGLTTLISGTTLAAVLRLLAGGSP